MGFLDDMKKQANELADKAEDLAAEHKDQVQGGLAKAADFVDDKTGGKHSEQIDKAQAKADGFVEKATKD